MDTCIIRSPTRFHLIGTNIIAFAFNAQSFPSARCRHQSTQPNLDMTRARAECLTPNKQSKIEVYNSINEFYLGVYRNKYFLKLKVYVFGCFSGYAAIQCTLRPAVSFSRHVYGLFVYNFLLDIGIPSE